MYQHYNKNLREYARELRTESVSKAEKHLWKALLSRKQTGYGFMRQRPVDRFIVDFCCQQLMLIVEVDGSSHFSKAAYDAYRQKRLESLGFTVVRFTEGEVLNQFDDLANRLEHVILCLEERNGLR